MNSLILAMLVIVVYAEVLPTISICFEFIRTFITLQIAKIQYAISTIQEGIEQAQERMKPTNTFAVGFQAPQEEYYDELQNKR